MGRGRTRGAALALVPRPCSLPWILRQDMGEGMGNTKGKCRGQVSREREKNMSLAFEDLEVYQKSVDLTETVHVITDRMKSVQGYSHLVSQLRRAVTSIPLNTAEGYGRYKPGEKRRFYQIARASCFECIAALELCRRCRMIDHDMFSSTKRRFEEIGRMLTGLILSMDRRDQEDPVAEP